ncbi:MAG: D-aminoacylase [Chloroflexi bacterium]|nr:D-aminoacylase [Chloroflexota bacterium]
MADKIFRNGEIVDGSGKARFKADLAVEGDTIVAIGDLKDMQAPEIIDISGKVICPGFIDMHSHTDMSIAYIPEADSLLHQGITTAVTGHCGESPVPVTNHNRSYFRNPDEIKDIDLPWERLETMGGFLGFLEEIGTSLNITPIVGQGAIRSAVVGFSAERPTEDQMEAMQQLVEQAMDEGAIGISTGLIYPPGSYASTEELIEVTKPVGRRGGIYFSHIRDEGDKLIEATKEEIEIGRKTGAAIHHSHFKAAGRDNWEKAEPALRLIDQAVAEGLQMTSDMYPYTAGATGLVALLPEWAQEGGLGDIVKRLSDKATRLKMVASMKTEGFFSIAEWDKVLIAGSSNPAYSGKYISELAETSGKTPYDWIFDALLETRGQIGMILFMMSEENVKMQFNRPYMMVGTDASGMLFEGPFAQGAHPRAMGTFPRFLGKYVRDEKVLPLEEAIHRISGLPAWKLNFKDRGLIRRGYKADLVVFDPATILDKADFINPFQKPVGIDYVLVNGQTVVKFNVHTHARPGVITTH